ncbi:MAG TPA: cytidine deaminase [Thermoanaerobaculia bacterium]|jgi:cytidine deaminase|nr:cytidine deaminase [Thermoanaerobaculia bacterium]
MTIIAAADAARLAESKGVDIPGLMTLLLPEAAKFARPPVSNFHVGAVSRGFSGNLYFGANVEFAGEALSFTVHAEQSSVGNAWMNGEDGIDLIAVTAAPCGYCRQFLNELVTADRLVIAIPNETRSLRDLLPSAFGPRDLGIDGGLMQREDHALTIDADDEFALAALAAARRSYAPYSKSYAGVAVRTSDGRIASGAYAENAAFNPSMSPLEVALSQLNLMGGAFDAITEAVLVHVDSLHTNATRTVLSAVSSASLRTHPAS